MDPTNLLRATILRSADNRVVASFMERYGLRLGVSRFVAGNELTDGISVSKTLNARRIKTTINHLGESLTGSEAISAVVQDFADIYATIEAENVLADASVKLSHVGLSVDEELAFENVRLVCETAAEHDNLVWLDMEDSRTTDATLRVYQRLLESGHANVGLALQAYLYRTADDLRSLLRLSPNVRLVKGAYLEPTSIAFARRAEVDASLTKLIEISLQGEAFTAIGTHDERIIDRAITLVERDEIPRDRFEFQMMYGVRERLQVELAEQGYAVRVIVSYGDDWYRFFIRRLAERPANVLFVARNLVKR